jgi:hypothetical protein
MGQFGTSGQRPPSFRHRINIYRNYASLEQNAGILNDRRFSTEWSVAIRHLTEIVRAACTTDMKTRGSWAV